MTTPGDDSTPRDQRSVHISGVTGSVSVGDHNKVSSVYRAGAADDEAQRQLLDAIVEFRAGLAQLVRNDQTRALDAELAETEEEIRAEGQAAPGRLARLGELLAGATTLTGLLASGETLVQRVRDLIGM
ncbi:hypothetical protein [Streptomyces sp. WM6378]|uniref:hypothetical protein n=1 Tax=Streptomyces sp. WM6378 TaxID=1415557 RepID=UPI0006AFF284|nr:hypothetical protein [Streptomyces sp. WM6378]KOU39040.1 hypothetical protein ADK54_27220 [Streptomyces sp. WM6378]